MRKFLFGILTLIMCVCAFGLTACSSPESECKHKEEQTNTIIEASCTQTGLERTTCKDCGKILSEETISKLSHVESEWKTIVQASCTQSGVKQKTCVGCGILLESEEISKLSHDYNILKHNETKHWYECVCGKKDDEENHKGGTATCTELAICSVCNVEYGDYLSHKYDILKNDETKHWYECVCGKKDDEENHIHVESEWKTIVQASCTQTGLERTTCKDCGKILSEEISKLSHAESEWKTIVQASCTQSGVKQKTCVGCGLLLESEEISKLSHDYNILKHNETKHWYECVCGKKDDEENHKGGTATCTELAICSVCNIEYGDYLSHKYDILKYDETKHWYECVCGKKDDEENHKGGTATCTKLAICSVCNVEYGDFAPTEGLCFALINNDTEYIVTDYIGFSTEVFIPNAYKGKPITSIGEDAFRDCGSLTSIVIPDSVTSIGNYAFYNCGSLISIVMPDSVTSIGEDVFESCSSLESVVIGDSVTSIGKKAFYNCKSLTSVTIGSSVTCIGNYAFYNCGSLTSIVIPYSVTSIGDLAFYNCGSLTSIEIPYSVTSIGWKAFYNCKSLTSIVIPDSVTSIDISAFAGCNSLTIYCEASEKPKGWSDYWNPDNRPVEWGYTTENNCIKNDFNFYVKVVFLLFMEK